MVQNHHQNTKIGKNIKFVAGGSAFMTIRGECPKLSAKIKQIYLEQINIDY